MQKFFEEWYEKYKTASIATSDRAEQIAEVAKEVEVRQAEKKNVWYSILVLQKLINTTGMIVLTLGNLRAILALQLYLSLYAGI